MDNNSSSPQLIIPTIPASDCPKGSLVEALNYIFQTYLGQAVINIPGLGDVTPAEIAALQDADIGLQVQIEAIKGSARKGTAALAAGDQNIVITFSSAMPSADYDIHVELIDTSTGATTTSGWGVMTGTKSTNGVTLRFYDIPATITSFAYSVRQIL